MKLLSKCRHGARHYSFVQGFSLFRNAQRPATLLVFCALLQLFAGCSGTDGDTVTFISGRALYPGAGVIGRSETPHAGATLLFEDYSPNPVIGANREPFLGFSDQSGFFSVSIEDTKLVLLTAEILDPDGTLRILSSFFATDGTIQEKNLTGVTTLTSEAILTALQLMLIERSDLDLELLANFEQQSQVVSRQRSVDIEDPTSVAFAVDIVLTRMFPGVYPPGSEEEDEDGEEIEEIPMDEEDTASEAAEEELLIDATPQMPAEDEFSDSAL